MSNDMKLIMEEWRKTINETTPELIDDPETASELSLQMQQATKCAEDESCAEAMRTFAQAYYIFVQAVDPTGITAWQDLLDSIDEYADAAARQEDTLSLGSIWENLTNTFWVAVNSLDSIPILALAAKPVTLPIKGARAIRRMAKYLPSPVAKELAKQTYKLERKIKMSKNFRKYTKGGSKTIADIIGYDKLSKWLAGTVGVAIAGSLMTMLFDWIQGKKDLERTRKDMAAVLWVEDLYKIRRTPYVSIEAKAKLESIYKNRIVKKIFDHIEKNEPATGKLPEEEIDALLKLLKSSSYILDFDSKMGAKEKQDPEKAKEYGENIYIQYLKKADDIVEKFLKQVEKNMVFIDKDEETGEFLGKKPTDKEVSPATKRMAQRSKMRSSGEKNWRERIYDLINQVTK
jgi:hypothetical protein